MTDQPPPELFAQRPVRSDFARRGPSYAVRRFVTVAVLLLLIGGGLYWKFSGSSSPTVPDAVPTLKAEGAYKQRPEQPGGLDIPHQDVQVYQALDNNATPKPEAEHLLPPPEVPQTNSVASVQNMVPAPPTPKIESLLPPEPKTEIAAVPVTPEPVPPPVPLPVPAPAPVVVATVTAPTSTSAPAAVPAPQPAKASPLPSPVAATAHPTMVQVLKDVAAQGKVGPAVQLASIPDESQAQALMKKLQAKYASILGSTQLHVVKADLGTKGIYYRIQSRPVADEQAKKICSAIKDLNAGCIIVRP